MADKNYSMLLREAAKGTGSSGGPRKRRKRNNEVEEPKETILVASEDDESEQLHELNKHIITDSESDFDSDEFEDVDIGNALPDLSKQPEKQDESFTFAIHQQKQQARKKTVVSKDERRLRRTIHQWSIVTMICHGAMRNLWCNDYELLTSMRNMVPESIVSLIEQQNTDALTMVKARRFLDGMRNLMQIYAKKFTVTKNGLIRKNWGELSMVQPNVERNMTFRNFKRLIMAYQGSRDLGAQGFVCLLRSLGLRTRLVYSLQTPDFTSLAITDKPQEPQAEEQQQKNIGDEERSQASSRTKFLVNQRLQPTSVKKVSTLTEQSPYPVFWVEVWNKYLKKWVSIDPVTLKTVEVAPMRKRSAFEPPASDTRNQMTYVVAFDRLGGVRDVTRRYSFQFNAKTAKKRISSRSNEDSIWYNRVLRAVTSPVLRGKTTAVEGFELKEFHDRDKAEGMPNSITDFKNHPLYVLRSQLHQNEIIYPDDETSKVGTYRSRTKNNSQVLTVYKRGHVHLLRSARGWYMRGRVLKVGVQALKVKMAKRDESDDEDGERLYAEFQTSLYIPPAITDGKIPKNAYGNIDVYVPSMLPENGCLLKVDKEVTLKMLERAARIIDIDYARAIVKFDFGKGNKATAKEGGVVFDNMYKEAMNLIVNQLVDEERERQEQMVELNALRNWKYFLTRLRISERLVREHGKVSQKEADSQEESVEEENEVTAGGFEVEREQFEEGDFVVEENEFEEPQFNNEAGGFYVEEEQPVTDARGFEVEEGKPVIEAGGFEVEEGDQVTEAGDFNTEEHNIMEETDLVGGGFDIEDAVKISSDEHESADIKQEPQESSEADVDTEEPTSAELGSVLQQNLQPLRKLHRAQSAVPKPKLSDDTMVRSADKADNQFSQAKATVDSRKLQGSQKIKTDNIYLKPELPETNSTSDTDDGVSEIPASFFHTNSSGQLEYVPGGEQNCKNRPDAQNSVYPKRKEPRLYTGETVPQQLVLSFLSKGSTDEYGFEFDSE